MKYSHKLPEKEAAAATPHDGDERHSCHHDPSHSDSTVIDTTEASLMESLGLPTSFGKPGGKSIKIGGNGDDEEPPEEKPVNLKRSHELDVDEINSENNHIKSQFELMGYIFNDHINDNQVINGEVVYRKKHVRLHTRMLKMFPNNNAMKPKHTYFDDDGNEINESNNQSGADTLHASSSDEEMPIPATRLSSSIVPQFTTQLSSDGNANDNEDIEQNKEEIVNINLSIDQDYDSNCIDEAATLNETQSLSKKEKKKKRKGKFQMSIPVEIANDKVLKKYWYKRFSLFNLFDFGIRLDRGEF